MAKDKREHVMLVCSETGDINYYTSRSKTANILYAVALDNRLKERGIRATSLHPGGIQTELGRHMTPELRAQIQKRIAASKEAATFKFKTVPQINMPN